MRTSPKNSRFLILALAILLTLLLPLAAFGQAADPVTPTVPAAKTMSGEAPAKDKKPPKETRGQALKRLNMAKRDAKKAAQEAKKEIKKDVKKETKKEIKPVIKKQIIKKAVKKDVKKDLKK